MTTETETKATLSELHRVDGSATFSQNGFTVMAAVNGPIEVQRRDELPEEAAVDVIIRPAAGIGGTRERHLEAILQSTLRQIILIHNFPRTLIQITLQIMSTPVNEASNAKIAQNSSILPLLPALLQTSVLALVSAALPLAMTLTSTVIALEENGSSTTLIQNPTPLQIQQAASTHIFSFTSHRQLLVAESEGEFSLKEWNNACKVAERLCCGGDQDDLNAMRDDGDEDLIGGMQQFVKSLLHEKVVADLYWQK